MIWAILTAIAWGACYAATERVVDRIDGKTYLIFSCFISIVGFIGLGLYDGNVIKDLRKENVGVLGWAVLASGAALVGGLFSVNAVKSCGASTAASLECSYPLFTLLFSIAFGLGGNLSWSTMGGAALIMAGTLVVVSGKY